MKKMLILNGSHSEVTLIIEAKKLGYYVITTGNNPKLIGHGYADEYIKEDYSDKDAILKIAREKNIDAICSCANDFGCITAAYVAEKMGLDGHDSYEVARLLHQKDGFKRFARNCNLQTPISDIYDNLEQALAMKDSYPYPMIVKPVDLTGGKGVKKVCNESEYVEAIKNALGMSRKGVVVVEKYIEGTYHSFSTFLIDKKVIAYYSDNEYSYINPYFVCTSGGPATKADMVEDILIEQAEIVADRLNLVNGVFHMQYVMDENYVPYIIDITRRCSGDVYPEPVEHATGIPWSKWIVMSEAGFDSEVFVERGHQKKFCGRHCIMARQNGEVDEVIISDELQVNIYDKMMWYQKGDKIENYLVDKLGILFLEYSSEEEMIEKIKNIDKLIKVKIK